MRLVRWEPFGPTGLTYLGIDMETLLNLALVPFYGSTLFLWIFGLVAVSAVFSFVCNLMK